MTAFLQSLTRFSSKEVESVYLRLSIRPDMVGGESSVRSPRQLTAGVRHFEHPLREDRPPSPLSFVAPIFWPATQGQRLASNRCPTVVLVPSGESLGSRLMTNILRHVDLTKDELEQLLA